MADHQPAHSSGGERCFILGAGFSVEAGYPLGRSLLTEAREARDPRRIGQLAPWGWFEDWWSSESDWLKRFFPCHPALEEVDVELLFTLMDLKARQLRALEAAADKAYLKLAHAGEIKPEEADAAWAESHKAVDDQGQKKLRRAKQALGEAVHELFDLRDAQTEVPGYVETFCRLLFVKDTCVVFNYDLLVERGLLKLGRWKVEDGWGFKIAVTRAVSTSLEATETKVLKPHGSIGWRVRRSGTLGMEDHILQRLDTTITAAPRFALQPDQWVEKDMALLDPSYLKPTDHVALRPLWRSTFRALQRSREWVFCGYSFPPADLAARTLVALALADRVRRTAVVIDPDRNVASRIASLLRQEVRHLEATAGSWLVEREGRLQTATTITPGEAVDG